MSLNFIVNQAIDQLDALLQSIAELNGKTARVKNVEQLMDEMKNIPRPCCGILYEGMRAKVPDVGGLGAEMLVSLVLFMQTEDFGDSTTDNDAIILLDQMRDAIKRVVGPSGHKWRFQLEAPAVEKRGEVMWVQRWLLSAILTQ